MSKPLSARLRLMLYEDIALEVEAMENEFTRLTREVERLQSVLEGIAGFRLLDFMGPHAMALRCVDVARIALALAPAAQGTAAQDDGCICKGNWRAIVKETEHLLDREFTDKDGNLYTFYGIVHGSDDYYYGMIGKTGRELLSCVGSIESYGFDLATNTQGEAK